MRESEATPIRYRECCPIAEPGLLPGEAEEIAARFKALADPTRVQIMNLLLTRGEGACVCDMGPLFGLSQPTISHHLRILREAGLVRARKQGTWRFYTADRATVGQLGAALTLEELDRSSSIRYGRR